MTTTTTRPAAPLPDEVDVLVVGTGPAGLVLAAQLARFADVETLVVEQRDGPLEKGHADGVACRSVETFAAFGFAHRVLHEASPVTETHFWGPDPQDLTRVVQTGRVPDVEDGLSEMPHVILNQARIGDFLLDAMREAPAALVPTYGVELVGLDVPDGAGAPVLARLRRVADGSEHVVRARHVVGCDGARSTVRRSIGRELRGDSANVAWGVMDVLAVTDFPDVRFKAFVRSATDGTLLLIPREGGRLVRAYVEMAHLEPGERAASRGITADDVAERARRILHPFSFEVRAVDWWSVYEIGQRMADGFDDVPEGDEGRLPRVLLAGDACHTHSPKAGQGMNVSIQDGVNLGWKLGAVLTGRARPQLLRTYAQERTDVARDLIAFDREWAAMLTRSADGPEVDPVAVQEHFVRQGRYTAGVATRYAPGLLTGDGRWQRVATGFGVGERFHSAPVVRVCDALRMHLGHVHDADGRWRLYAFGDRADVRDDGSRLRAFCRALEDPARSPVLRFTRAGEDVDAVVDVRAVLQQPHDSLLLSDLPPALLPRTGPLGLVDHQKPFAADPTSDVFDLRGVDRDTGALVLVRPDQYVATVLPLDAVEELAEHLGRALLPAR